MNWRVILNQLRVISASLIGTTRCIPAANRILPLLASLPFVVTAPIAGYFLHQWLLLFAYRIELSREIFGIAGILTASIALITISIQALQSAVANPIKSLQSE